MTEKVYQETRSRLRADQARLQEEIEQVAAQIRALDMVWTQLFSGAAVADGGDAAAEPVADDGNPFNRKLVEIVVGGMKGYFSVREVEAEIARRYPHITLSRNNIAMKLKRMSEEDPPAIELVEAGVGRRPSTYRRK